ncbi:MAG: hypothetical protein BEN19_02910 [Epulopiscium sp. Nuni2H_MBin003]|nr:MAG: hypothetical protein BEN19_02910 [Epulopiscium sp. Nuni2H_MBin003]
MSNVISYGFASLIKSILDLHSKSLLGMLQYINKDLDNVKNESLDIFTNLTSIMGVDDEYKLPFIEKLINISSSIVNKSDHLIFYKQQLLQITKHEQLQIIDFTPTDFLDIKLSLTEISKIQDEDELIEEADLLQELIDDISNICEILYEISQLLLKILTPTDLTFDHLKNLYPTFSDFYHCTVSIINQTGDYKIYLEELPQSVVATITEIIKEN